MIKNKKVLIAVLALIVLLPFNSFAAYSFPSQSDLSENTESYDTVVSETKETQSLIAEQVELNVHSNKRYVECDRFLDGKEKTFQTIFQDVTLHIEGSKPFSSLYLKFEYPIEWLVKLPDGTELEGGKNGFIHEWLPLGQSVLEADIFLVESTRLTEIYAFTKGELPSWVQVWQPPCESADLMVMPTHADDEHLWFGGAMPYYAGEMGYNVQVVYMTNHRYCTIRCHERLNGLWTVGITHYPIIPEAFTDVPDARKYSKAKEIYGYDNVLAYQVEMLRRFRPKVVIAHDIDGEYGHGAHILNVKTLLDALELTDDPSAYPESAEKYGTCQVQKVYLHLWPEHQITMDWDKMKLSRFDGKSALDMAKAGFACHESQQAHYKVRDKGKYDCRLFGLAYTNVGWDTPDRNDMFENVVWPEQDSSKEETDEVISPTDASPSDAVSSPPGQAESHADMPDGRPGRGLLKWIVAANAAVVVIFVFVLVSRRFLRKRTEQR